MIKTPKSCGSLSARCVDFFHSLHRITNSTAMPVKRRHANIPFLCFPFAICTCIISIFIYCFMHDYLNKNKKETNNEDYWKIYVCIPGGVPQHMDRSSTCSTSRPKNHAPSETSSLAYRCKMGLQMIEGHITQAHI